MHLLPEFQNDESLAMLREMFQARFVSQENKTHFIGIWPPSVKIGPDEFIQVGEMELAAAVDKAELEMARSQMFAAYLLDQSREDAVRAYRGAVEHEPQYFIDNLKKDLDELKKRRGLA